jgi:hypothetical protein
MQRYREMWRLLGVAAARHWSRLHRREPELAG